VNSDPTAAIPGWYGKLPSLGDFASRRLPAGFVEVWDKWLQEVLSATRAAMGDAWLDCYLVAPIWRFVLLPGLASEDGWAGVLMPSVDRVGRQFPLTLTVALRSPAAVAYAVFEGAGWFAELEDAALAALDATRSADDLDHDLEACDPRSRRLPTSTPRWAPSSACPRPTRSGRWPRSRRSAPGAGTRAGERSGGRAAASTARR
jgi:type VI secretion system ImpM family protein